METQLDEKIEQLFKLVEAGKMDECEILRQIIICDHIDAISDLEKKRKAIVLQQKIERERIKFKGTQYQFASYIFGRMWSSFLDMDYELEAFRGSAGDLQKSMRLQKKPPYLKVVHTKSK